MVQKGSRGQGRFVRITENLRGLSSNNGQMGSDVDVVRVCQVVLSYLEPPLHGPMVCCSG